MQERNDSFEELRANLSKSSREAEKSRVFTDYHYWL